MNTAVYENAVTGMLVLKRDVNSGPVAGTYYTVDIIK